jgi:hypothetical protein
VKHLVWDMAEIFGLRLLFEKDSSMEFALKEKLPA